MIKNTSAIVVTYNRINLLKECLSALEKQTKKVCHIIVINNNSTDETESYLRTLDKNLYIVYNSKVNLGGAGGFSKGIEIAYADTKDDSFWLMDDDTIVDESCNETLSDTWNLLGNKAGFLISNVRWTNGEPANVMTPTDNWPEKISNGLIQVKNGSFVSFSVTRTQVERYGLPIGEMFIWGDDTEYSLRLSQHSPGYFVNDAVVTHKSKSNNVASGLDKEEVNRIERYFYLYRNSMYTKKTYRGTRGVCDDLFNGGKMFIKIILHSHNKKLKRIKILLKGIIFGFSFNPSIKKVQ